MSGGGLEPLPFDFDAEGIDQSLPSSAKEQFRYERNWENRLRKLRKYHRLHEQHKWHMSTGKGSMAQGRADFSKPPLRSRVKNIILRPIKKVRNFFGGDERIKAAPTRTSSPIRGSSNTRPDAPTKRGFFDPPKRTTPSAGRRNRLSAFRGKQQPGKRGGVHGGFGGSGVSGVKSSYHARSVLYTARDLRSRIRLTSVGFWALELARVSEVEMESLNREVSKPIEEGGLNAPGGILAADTRELDKFLDRRGPGAASLDAGGAMIRRSANLVLGSVFSLGQIITRMDPLASVSPLSTLDKILGGSGSKGSILQMLEKGKNIMNAWAEDGQPGANEMAGIIETWGSPERKQQWEAKQARERAFWAMKNKFFREAANEITGSVQGVPGRVILRALAREGEFESELMRKAVVDQNEGPVAFRVKQQGGTKE